MGSVLFILPSKILDSGSAVRQEALLNDDEAARAFDQSSERDLAPLLDRRLILGGPQEVCGWVRQVSDDPSRGARDHVSPWREDQARTIRARA